MQCKIRCFFVLTVLLCGCKINKEKNEQQSYGRQQNYSNQQQRQVQDFRRTDSIGRYWTFQSDSSFYYHPDSGLRGSRGLLFLWEYKLHKQNWTSILDSNRTELATQEQHSLWKKYYRSIQESKWIIAVCLLFLAAGYCWYRYIRF